MTTYAEAIAAKRAEREKINVEIMRQHELSRSLSAEILALEEVIRPPKGAKINRGDVVMPIEPATVGAKAGG